MINRMQAFEKNSDDAFVSASDLQIQFPDSKGRLGAKILDDFSISVDQGELVSIVGPSGCGKSTFLRIAAALQKPTSGNISINGAPPDRLNRDGCRLAFVFQDPNLLPWRKAIGNVTLPLELAGVPKEERNQRALKALLKMGLQESDFSKLPRMLSGGMKMRVSIARAMVTQPNVFLFDEPFAALDDVLRGQLNEELLMLWNESQWTVLFVTHNISEAVFLSQRVLVMGHGKIVDEIKIDLPFPRDQSIQESSDYQKLVVRVSQSLRRGQLKNGANS